MHTVGLDLVEMLEDVLGIDDGDDSVQHELEAQLGVHEESLRDRRGIRQARGLDQHIVELVLLLLSSQTQNENVSHPLIGPIELVVSGRGGLTLTSSRRMRIRSPRTVQQMQPLFIWKISSLAANLSCRSESSIPTSVRASRGLVSTALGLMHALNQ